MAGTGCAPPGDDPYDGLSCSGTLEGTVRTIVELSGRDMRRRKFRLGSTFSATAFAQPTLFARTVPPVGSTARAGGRRVGMADVGRHSLAQRYYIQALDLALRAGNRARW